MKKQKPRSKSNSLQLSPGDEDDYPTDEDEKREAYEDEIFGDI